MDIHKTFAMILILLAQPSDAYRYPLSKELPTSDDESFYVEQVYEEVERQADRKFSSLSPISYRSEGFLNNNQWIKVKGVDAIDLKVSYLHLHIYLVRLEPHGRRAKLVSIRVGCGRDEELEPFEEAID